MLILIGRGLNLKIEIRVRPKGKLKKTGQLRDEENLDVRFSGYARGQCPQPHPTKLQRCDGLSDEAEIIEKARDVRRVSKKEASVKNGRSGNQEDKGLHKPFIGIPVTMAKGSHLFPYRTQKLSLSAPMVLGWRRPGRVGRCRIPNEKRLHSCGVFFHLQSGVCNSLGQPQPSAALHLAR